MTYRSQVSSRDDLVKEAALSGGSAEGDDGATGGGDHGADGDVEVVGDAGGLVEDEEADSGEAADGVGASGQGEDAGAVVEEERMRIAGFATGAEAETAQEGGTLAEEFGGLAKGGGDDQGQAGGRAVEEVMDGEDSGRCGLAPLAGAVEEAAGVPGAEDGGLDGVGGKGEAGVGEGDRIGGGEEVGGKHCAVSTFIVPRRLGVADFRNSQAVRGKEKIFLRPL